MIKPRRLTFALCFGGMLLPSLAAAQSRGVSLAGAADDFDCVIEPKQTIKLGSVDAGIIESVKVDRGAFVHKGDVVAVLESTLQQVALEASRLKASNELDIRSERARLVYRTAEAARNEALHGSSFVSTKSYEESQAEQRLAEFAVAKAEFEHRMAQLDLMQAQAKLERRSIRSPVDGVVADVTIRPGEYASEQNPIMTIDEIDPLYVKVFVPVKYFGRVLAGSTAEVRPEQPIGGTYRARVTVVDRIFDAASSTFGIRLELPNEKDLVPAGLRCSIHFDPPPGG